MVARPLEGPNDADDLSPILSRPVLIASPTGYVTSQANSIMRAEIGIIPKPLIAIQNYDSKMFPTYSKRSVPAKVLIRRLANLYLRVRPTIGLVIRQPNSPDIVISAPMKPA